MTKHVDVLSSDDAPVPVRAPGHDGPLSGTPCVGTDNDQAVRWRRIARSRGACDGQREKTTERMLRRVRLAEFLAVSERCSDNAKIEVLDRPTAVSAVLSWRDSTGGSYDYQIWKKGKPADRGNWWASEIAVWRYPSARSAFMSEMYISF